MVVTPWRYGRQGARQVPGRGRTALGRSGSYRVVPGAGPQSQHPAEVGKFRAEAVPHSTKLCKNPLCSGERETSLGSSGLYQRLHQELFLSHVHPGSWIPLGCTRGDARNPSLVTRSGHELLDTWSPWVVPEEIPVATPYSRAKENAKLGCTLGCTRGFTGGHS